VCVCVCVCAFTRYAASSRIFAPVRHGVFAVVGRAALTHGYSGDCCRSTVTAAASVFYLRFQPLLAYYAEQGLCTVRCPSVSLSVCPSMGPQQQTRCCRFAVVGRKRLIDCCTAGALQQRAAGECGQCHVGGVRKKLNTDFVLAGCVTASVRESVCSRACSLEPFTELDLEVDR